jgi:FtsP/CotA-like multicopper oxidase with cupredoxin domain
MNLNLTRRQMLAATAAFAAAPVLAETPRILRAAPTKIQLAPAGYGAADIWAYDGGAPGPEIRVRQGERVRLNFRNDLPQPSTVHWHGIRIDNAMDGVASLTQEAVEPGAEFAYDFVAPDAGTYWYHPHYRSWEQLARGLYGPLIVEELTPPGVDRDLTLMLDDWRLAQTGAIDESFGAMGDWSHAGRIGNWITVNGDGAWRNPVKRGERLRLRLINAANSRIFTLSLQGAAAWVAALDGQPLETLEAVGRMTLAPSQRIDLIVDVTDETEALLISHERDGGYAAASFPVEGVLRDAGLAPPAPLPPNPVPPLGDLEAAGKVDLLLEGGAMGGMTEAMRDGRMMGMRELVNAGMVWAMNGGMPETPLFVAERGRTMRIRMINETAWPHAMHLHGHHFRRIDGASPGPLRDTILVQRGETAEIALMADNPGKWMIHCHMLEHQASGMMSWFGVA